MNVEKYRSVSVLVGQSTVFEILMLDQLMESIQGTLSDLLSACRKGCSTHHVLMHDIEECETGLDREQHVGVVIMDLSKTYDMDLSKAYDAIPHSLLLVQLHSYGLQKHVCEMIRSYLTNCKQKVKIDEIRSCWQ